MYFGTFVFAFLLLSQLAMAQGRKPAVEDFVGIEIQHPKVPQGTEALFNFEKDVSTYLTPKTQSTDKIQQIGQFKLPTLTGILSFIFIMGLPGMIWFLMIRHLRRQAHLESASNIEVLERFRREREKTKKDQEHHKKSA